MLLKFLWLSSFKFNWGNAVVGFVYFTSALHSLIFVFILLILAVLRCFMVSSSEHIDWNMNLFGSIGMLMINFLISFCIYSEIVGIYEIVCIPFNGSF